MTFVKDKLWRNGPLDEQEQEQEKLVVNVAEAAARTRPVPPCPPYNPRVPPSPRTPPRPPTCSLTCQPLSPLTKPILLYPTVPARVKREIRPHHHPTRYTNYKAPARES